MPEPPVLPANLPPDILDYGFATLPAPLQVSAASADSPGAITIWAGQPGKPVYCSQIAIAVPIGPAGTDLSAQNPSVTPNTQWWAISSIVTETGDKLGLSPAISYKVFYSNATSSEHWLIDYDLQFSIVTAAVNQAEGTFGLVIAEISGFSQDSMEQRRSIFDILKGPVTGYLASIVTTAAPPGSTSVPVSEFSSGQPVRIAWQSNAASFAVYAGSATTPVWSGPDTSAVLAAGLTRDTTLTVVASGDLGVLMVGTTVTVTNPSLTPASVTSGTLTAAGAAKLAAAVLANLSAASLAVTGPATLAGVSASALTGTGGATLRGTASASSAAVTGRLTAPGAASLGAISATSLNVTTRVSMLNPRGISPGSYAANTDGLVVGTVWWPGNAGQKCAAIAYASSAGSGTVYARGGNRVIWTDGKKLTSWSVGGSFLLPVRRGAGFSIGITQVNGRDVDAPASFAWVPFGTSAAASSLQELSPDQAAAYGLDASPPALPLDLAVPSVTPGVHDVMQAVEAILGDRLTPELRGRLRHAVVALATRRSEHTS